MKMLGEERIRLLPVIELIIVRAGINVVMPRECVLFSIQPVEGLDLIVKMRLLKRRPEAILVLNSVDQEGWPGRLHGCKYRIIGAHKEVGRVIFHVTDVRIALNCRHKSEISGDRNRHGDTFVESAQCDGLPCSTG